MKCGESDTRNETYQENFSEEKFYKLKFCKRIKFICG